MSKPDVSIIAPAWKAAAFIERAVMSALASQGVSVEMVIVDDASPDETWKTLQQLAQTDPRIIIDRLPANSGPSVARNRAIALSSGRYIAVLDADDAITPDRLARLAALADKTDADITVDNMLEVDAAGARIGQEAFLRDQAFASPRSIDLDTWIAFNQPMKPGDCLGYLKPLFRRSMLDRLGAQYDPALRNSEDYYLVAELLAAGASMTFTPEAGYLYTRAAGSTSHRLKPEQTRAWLTAEAAFQRRHAARLSPEQKAALSRRMRALRNVDHMVAATDALKARRIGEFLRLLASDISAAAFTLRIFAGVAISKAFSRKPA